MVQAVRRCMGCGQPITPTFWLCIGCEDLFGVGRELPFAEWPADAREFKRVFQRQRDRERRQLENESDSTRSAIVTDVLLYGAFNTDATDDIDDPVADEWGAEAWGRLRCVRCDSRFSDVWPTWPQPWHTWQEPVCPECGASHYADTD